MRAGLVLFGYIAALLILAALYPSACGATDVGIPPGGPDPNLYGCDSLLLKNVDSIDGPVAGTDERKTGLDVLQTRMMLNATTTAAVPLLLALGTAIYAGRREDLDPAPEPSLPRVVGASYALSVIAAIFAALYAAISILNNPIALLSLVMPVYAASVAAFAGNRRWVWAAVIFQIGFAGAAALPLGFLFIPSALLMLFAAGVELVLRIEHKVAVEAGASDRA